MRRKEREIEKHPFSLFFSSYGYLPRGGYLGRPQNVASDLTFSWILTLASPWQGRGNLGSVLFLAGESMSGYETGARTASVRWVAGQLVTSRSRRRVLGVNKTQRLIGAPVAAAVHLDDAPAGSSAPRVRLDVPRGLPSTKQLRFRRGFCRASGEQSGGCAGLGGRGGRGRGGVDRARGVTAKGAPTSWQSGPTAPSLERPGSVSGGFGRDVGRSALIQKGEISGGIRPLKWAFAFFAGPPRGRTYSAGAAVALRSLVILEVNRRRNKGNSMERIITDEAGNPVFAVEVIPTESPLRSGTSDAVLATAGNIHQIGTAIAKSCSDIFTSVRESAEAALPDELEVSFGVTLSSEAGIVWVKAAGEASFVVTARWTNLGSR